MNFLIVLLAIITVEAYGELAFIQRDEWVRKWHQGLAKLSFLQSAAKLKVAVFVLVPAVVLQLVLLAMAQSHLGFFVFLLELLVLLYALGRGNLDTQVSLLSSDLERDDLQAAFHDAAVFNTAHRESNASNSSDLRSEIFAALPYRIFERSFAVVFLFFFLGAPAALCYRLLALHGDLSLEADESAASNKSAAGKESAASKKSSVDESVETVVEKSSDQNSEAIAAPNPHSSSDLNSPALKLLWLLEWIPVRLLGFTVGLVGSFSDTATHLRELLFCRQTATAELLRRCVQGALGKSEQADPESETLNKAEINEVTSLFRRSMTAWLVGIAILVILS
jgi:AmpE protein